MVKKRRDSSTAFSPQRFPPPHPFSIEAKSVCREPWEESPSILLQPLPTLPHGHQPRDPDPPASPASPHAAHLVGTVPCLAELRGAKGHCASAQHHSPRRQPHPPPPQKKTTTSTNRRHIVAILCANTGSPSSHWQPSSSPCHRRAPIPHAGSCPQPATQDLLEEKTKLSSVSPMAERTKP